MAIGSYGNTRGADVDIDDISMYYNYIPNRETLNNNMLSLVTSDMLTNCVLPKDDSVFGFDNYKDNILEGLYNLALPSSIFNQLGIYTVYIKPKSFPIKIQDCSVLSAMPTVRGIVIKLSDLNSEKLKTNNGLQGYRIEFINSDGTKMRNVVRHVVSSNRAVAINDITGNTSQKTIRYRFDDSGNLIFLQLSPSSATDVKSNALPFMGNIGQTIIISNTNFSPVAVEIEMVQNTLDTIANSITGDQIKDVQKGLITSFDENKEITNQWNVFDIKSDMGNTSLFEVREKRTNIDTSQNFNNVLKDITP